MLPLPSIEIRNLNLSHLSFDRKVWRGFRSGFCQWMYQIVHIAHFECVINLIECKQARMRRGATRWVRQSRCGPPRALCRARLWGACIVWLYVKEAQAGAQRPPTHCVYEKALLTCHCQPHEIYTHRVYSKLIDRYSVRVNTFSPKLIPLFLKLLVL